MNLPIIKRNTIFLGPPTISGDESSRRESTIMKDVVSTLPVLKNVFSRFFAQSILIGSFFGCSRCLDLVWVQPDFFSQVFQIAVGRRKATKCGSKILNPFGCGSSTWRSQWRAVFFTPGRCGASSAKITFFQLVFGWYISIYIDKFWRCFSFGPPKIGRRLPHVIFFL